MSRNVLGAMSLIRLKRKSLWQIISVIKSFHSFQRHVSSLFLTLCRRDWDKRQQQREEGKATQGSIWKVSSSPKWTDRKKVIVEGIRTGRATIAVLWLVRVAQLAFFVRIFRIDQPLCAVVPPLSGTTSGTSEEMQYVRKPYTAFWEEEEEKEETADRVQTNRRPAH